MLEIQVTALPVGQVVVWGSGVGVRSTPPGEGSQPTRKAETIENISL